MYMIVLDLLLISFTCSHNIYTNIQYIILIPSIKVIWDYQTLLNTQYITYYFFIYLVILISFRFLINNLISLFDYFYNFLS